jgi:hypothetical protein
MDKEDARIAAYEELIHRIKEKQENLAPEENLCKVVQLRNAAPALTMVELEAFMELWRQREMELQRIVAYEEVSHHMKTKMKKFREVKLRPNSSRRRKFRPNSFRQIVMMKNSSPLLTIQEVDQFQEYWKQKAATETTSGDSTSEPAYPSLDTRIANFNMALLGSVIDTSGPDTSQSADGNPSHTEMDTSNSDSYTRKRSRDSSSDSDEEELVVQSKPKKRRMKRRRVQLVPYSDSESSDDDC